MKGYIYFIENNANEKKYIGSTTNLKRRFRQHLCTTRYLDKWHQDLHNNPENWTFGILEIIEDDDFVKFNSKMAEREIHFYNKFKNGAGVYNLVKPSITFSRGKKYSNERLEKQREAHYGRPHKSSPNTSLINEKYNYAYVNRM